MGEAEQCRFGETEHGRKPRISRKRKWRSEVWPPWRNEMRREVVVGGVCMDKSWWVGKGGI